VLERFRVDEMLFQAPEDCLTPLEHFGSGPTPPFFRPQSRAEIDACIAQAPLWPNVERNPTRHG